MRRARMIPIIATVSGFSAALALSTQSCGIIDSSGSGGSGAGPASLSIVSPCDDLCVELPPGADPYVPVFVTTENVVLKPIDVCGQNLTTSVSSSGSGGAGGIGGGPTFLLSCGHLELSVNGIVNNEGSGTEIDLLLRKLANPLGKMHVEVRLARESQTEFDFVDAAAPVIKFVDFTVATSCEGKRTSCGGGAGTGTGTGTGGQGGTGHGGTGGTGGTGLGGSGGIGAHGGA